MTPKGRRPFTIRPKVLVANPGAELRLLGKLPGIFSGEHVFILCPLDGGTRTRLVQSEIYRGLIVPVIGRTIDAAKRGFDAHNCALKCRVEDIG